MSELMEKSLPKKYPLHGDSRSHLRIGVLSKHPLVTDCISRAFHKSSRPKIAVMEMSDWPRAIEGSKPQVIIIDRPSLQWQADDYLLKIKASLPLSKAVILDRPLTEKELCWLMYLGGDGFVGYPRPERELPQAIKAVCLGRMWFPIRTLENFVSYVKEFARPGKKRAPFTPQERCILELLQQRLSNKEISNKLAIEQSTVKFHLKNIFDKLGVRDRHAAVEQIKMKTEFFGAGRLDIFTGASEYQPVLPALYKKLSAD